MNQIYRIPSDPLQYDLAFSSKDPFGQWARKYFKPKRCNCFIPVKEAFDSFVFESKMPVKRLQFRKALTNWCAKNEMELDPVEHRNTGNRIIRKKEISLGKWKAMEMIYVKSNQQ